MIYLIALVCPPFAALIAGKERQAWINLLLTLPFYVPGLIHALGLIKNAQNDFETIHTPVKR